ncbi:MAG: hypothetical protein C9356_20045 [Oleiphilus sp.]|nr:MAG: hypothetical protein C9356_20045 [Oleiphilus sp.]
MDCAIVGLSVSIPSNSMDEFWKSIEAGESFIQEISDERWNKLNLEGGNVKDKALMRGVFLKNIDMFDRKVFNMSPRRAMFSDPRQRLLLQHSWSAIEDAGLKISDLNGKRVGVFIAQDSWHWGAYIDPRSELYLENQEHIIPGNNPCFLASTISSFFNFKGPSLVFNTACSSFFVALQQAKDAIEQGACDYALVGGVTLFHNSLNDQFESLNEESVCFSDTAAGYVSSEGCGVFVLERLNLQQANRVVYGTLDAAVTNSGGATKSFACPSQTQLEAAYKRALDAANISSNDITYVEAHGAGSLLGDSMEANAIINTFARTETDPECSISSIKPNFGHAHAASGIYSLLKVLLSFKSRKIAPVKGLSSDLMNNEITKERAGVEFVTQPKTWERGNGLDSKNDLVRFALLSSYGVSNVNAALIVRGVLSEEVKEDLDELEENATLICLSAKSEKQVQQRIRDLLGVLDTGITLRDIAYTLQVGRESMDKRWAVVVTSIDDLKDKLSKAGEHITSLPSSFYQDSKVKNPVLEMLRKRPDELDQLLVSLFEAGDMEAIAQLWVSGVNIDFSYCYETPKPKLISLPCYPFERVAYWLPELKNAEKNVTGEERETKSLPIPPNEGGGETLIRLDPEYFYLRDHIVKDRPVLPGVYYLEMLRSVLPIDHGRDEAFPVQFKHVAWYHPIEADNESPIVAIEMRPNSSEKNTVSFNFEVTSQQGDLTDSKKIFSKGEITVGVVPSRLNLDLSELKSRFGELGVPRDEVYDYYKLLGLRYGESFRAIEELYLTERESLTKISLPTCLKNTQSEFVLHPSILDAAIQAHSCIDEKFRVFLDGAKDTEIDNLFVPYAFEELSVIAPLETQMYSWLRLDKASSGSGKIRKFDVDIINLEGNVCITIKGLSVRFLSFENTALPKAITVEQPDAITGLQDLRENSVERDSSEYLVRILSEEVGVSSEGILPSSAFSDYGMDSLMASKLTEKLEARYGNLPKTLFFEYENIRELAGYLREKFPNQFRLLESNEIRENASLASPEVDAKPWEISSDASVTPESGMKIFSKQELSVEEKEANISFGVDYSRFKDGAFYEMWPYIFMSLEEKAYVHLLEQDEFIFATNYNGEKNNELRTLQRLQKYCLSIGKSFCYLDLAGSNTTKIEKSLDLISLPVGYYQDIFDIANFNLSGKKMRRLRYQIEKFKKEGDCKTIEYVKEDPEVSRQIISIVLAWSEDKKVVNNVDVILRDIKSGELFSRYRVFLTYVNEELRNVILIVATDTGYLMDQEYYISNSDSSGTEFAVFEICKKLTKEGIQDFSLGLTWGLFPPTQPFSDEAGWEHINKSRGMLASIFENGAANFQYKNKFRPENKSIHFYRPNGSDVRLINQCLSQFFKKALRFSEIQSIVSETEAYDLMETGMDAPSSHVLSNRSTELKYDLISDSWAALQYPFIEERMDGLRRKALSKQGSQNVIETLFGMPHHVISTSGRSAERLFFRTFKSKKKKVIQNILFETTSHNLVSAGFNSIEIPDERIFNQDLNNVFVGGICATKLESLLHQERKDVAMVVIELCNNASGGCPVSMDNLKLVSQLCAQFNIPFILDITRIVRNAELIKRYEKGYEHYDIESIIKEVSDLATFVIGSLSKDFAINFGGIVAGHNRSHFEQLKVRGSMEGDLVGEPQRKLVYLALENSEYFHSLVKKQLKLSESLTQRLMSENISISPFALGHCLLISAGELANEREEYLKFLAEGYGIRGNNHLHLGRHTQENYIRLAIPLGLEDEGFVDEMIAALRALNNKKFGAGSDQVAALVNENLKVRRETLDGVSKSSHEPDNDIAIIGLSGTFPNASNIQEFWKNLTSGEKSIREIPPERWNWREFYCPDPLKAPSEKKSYCKWGGFIDKHDKFDPLFFGIAPSDAEYIDPQELLFLKECWKVFEDAGYDIESLPEQVRLGAGLYVGVTNARFNLFVEDKYCQTSFASIANRASHFLDLRGPSIAIDSHCASSLVAIHEACEYLRSGRGEVAIAGGVNINLHPSSYVHLSHEGLLSHGEDSAAFTKGGQGYVPGECVGAVLLKSHKKALADGDHVYALIRGSAVNHSGNMNQYGIANPKRQQAVIEAALEASGVSADSISYIETAAAGLEMIDAMETRALEKVFGGRSPNYGELKIGSVKPNIGHCEAAAGISQLVKVVMSMRNKELVKTLVRDELSSDIDLATFPLSLQQENTSWKTRSVDGISIPRRAGVTAVSSSGVNSHIIVEENPSSEENSRQPVLNEWVFVLSANNPQQLKAYIDSWLTYLRKNPYLDLTRAMYTLQTGRKNMPCRFATVFKSIKELEKKITLWKESENSLGSYFSDIRLLDLANKNKVINAKSLPHNDLARLWADGYKLDWSDYYSAYNILKLACLPTYPFADRKCWKGTFQNTSKALNEELNHGVVEAYSDDVLIKTALKEVLFDLMGFIDSDDISDDMAFVEMGLDSKKVVLFVQGLNQRLHVSLSETEVFDYPDISSLSIHIATKLNSIGLKRQDPVCDNADRTQRGADDILELMLKEYVDGNIELNECMEQVGRLES